MARKADDLLADLDQLGSEPTRKSTSSTKLTSRPKKAETAAGASAETNEDVLAELEAQLAAKPSGTSRPATPARLASSTASSNARGGKDEHTPASSGPTSARNSEDRARGAARSSGEAGRSYHQGQVAEESEDKDENVAASTSTAAAAAPASGGGWWGSMLGAATAAVKQAETLAKEIQGNEEAQKWAEQVRGNFKGLQSFGDDLRSRALPTFTTLISHIAPPISAHERLQIHLTHDIQHYPSLDPLVYSTFSRIMAQVEGGDLVVLQRGSENRSRPRTTSEQPSGYRGGILGSGGSGWTDGPWWREDHAKRELSIVPGLKEGSRLARVSAEAYAKEFFDARGGLEEAAKKASETLSETNPVRSSDIFLAIQAVSHTAIPEYFAADSRSEDTPNSTEAPKDDPEDLMTFAIYLHDPIHSLSFSTLTQPIPVQWAHWLDAPNTTSSESDPAGLPTSIQDIIAAGGVDPREWVAEWMEEVLALGVGVVAQKYVARRMGVGEGALGRGKQRVEDHGIGGEAARAI
ncbi:Hypothetical protein R9X50_00371700 [Acrodontium crateriforme]|uniref:Maintenance of telomere capping protein 1 n=1 Tax=Acrodontium crateriforme TaxID=150365 RepID=A0AAQ3RA39_9PEZI|nr:Hypothetical protein R9X50_00371700 [Acrodontium crateriforme]